MPQVKLFLFDLPFTRNIEKIIERKEKLHRKYKKLQGFENIDIETEEVVKGSSQLIQFYLLQFDTMENALNFARKVYTPPINAKDFIIQ